MCNLPNLISILRILLVPVFWVVFWSPGPHHIALGMSIFALAGLTDIIDGYIARKFGMVTELGKVLDPLADKLMVITAIFSLYQVKLLPVWLLILIIAKEAFIIIGGLFIMFGYRVRVSASKYGKAATVSLYIAIFYAAFNLAGSVFVNVIAAIISLAALINYIYGFTRHRLY